MALTGLILAVCALCACVYLYLELQKKLSSEDIGTRLSQASEELSKNYARELRAIETEWNDMYQKFSRLGGRLDKLRGLEAPQNPQPTIPFQGTRSDILRKSRGGA